MQTITVAIAPGELIDKIVILELKLAHIADPAKQANVRREWEILVKSRDDKVPASPALAGLTADLKAVNAKLWRIEDDIRDCERGGDFGPAFIALARAVYINNDERARLKRAINDLLGSDIVEEKSYSAY
jgi:Family of unknown function (DUF6165)